MRARRILAVAGVLALASMLMSGCRGRVIPAGKLSNIYADMFLADQWLLSNSSERRKADTTLFYEPIFRDYGYTTKDYIRSVDYYLLHTEKYAEILRDASKKLEKRHASLQALEDFLEQKRSMLDAIDKIDMQLRDSAAWCGDTLLLWPVAVDSALFAADSLQLSDSLAVAVDSLPAILPVKEELPAIDTVLRVHPEKKMKLIDTAMMPPKMREKFRR